MQKSFEKEKNQPNTNKLYLLMKEKSFIKPKEIALNETKAPTQKELMTQNLVSINKGLLLKEKAFDGLQKDLEEFVKGGKELSVMAYLNSLFDMMKRAKESHEPQVAKLFGLLLTSVEEPITRILEEFTRLRTLYKDRFQDLKSQKALLEENRLLEEKNRVLQAENVRLRGSKTGDFLYENQKLRGILQKQRGLLCEHRAKEEKMVKLLGLIRNKGIDIEGIYNEELRSEGDSAVFEPDVFMIKENDENDRVRTYSFNEAL